MASSTRFRQFLSKNWVLRGNFEVQYPQGAGKEPGFESNRRAPGKSQGSRAPAGRRGRARVRERRRRFEFTGGRLQ